MSEQRPYPSQEKQSGQTRWFSFLYRTRVMLSLIHIYAPPSLPSRG